MSVKEIFQSMTYGPAPESNQEAVDFLASHQHTFGLFIDGKWSAPDSEEHFETKNPSSGVFLANVANGNAADVDLAVRSARKAQISWAGLSGHQRAKYLYALARQIQKHARLFATLESMDNGKPIRESRDIDIPLVARHFYYHAGWAQLSSSEWKDVRPVGVVGQIIPWNFPLLMLSWKIAPALAMGNTVVLKPAEYTPLTALLFADICLEIGLPPGVVNIITGHGATGAALVAHPDVDKIAFTGSTEVGKSIRMATAGSGKKISLELGGKSPFLVFEDADLDSVVEGIVDAIWFNQGQVCCAGSRLLVQESVAEQLYAKIRRRMETLRMGNSLDKCIDIGAVVDPIQYQTIDTLVKRGIDEGNTCWQPSWKLPENGCFFPPTLFTDVAPSSVIAQEEIFGPVLVAMSFRTPSEAVRLANHTRYGLAASIWTENINLALDIAPQLKAGSVWINCSNQFDAASGFGGYRESGYGREGGEEGLREYCRLRIEDSFLETPVKPESGDPKERLKGSGIDLSPKIYIGGKQVRPDGGNSLPVLDASGTLIGEIPKANRKDIRNAVEAAHKASSWSGFSGHARAQILYYLGENMSLRTDELANLLVSMTHQSHASALEEVQKSIDRLFTYAAWADKFDGKVHSTLQRFVTMAMNEKIGVMGIACPDECPLLAFVSLFAPAIALGNTVVIIPSERFPLIALRMVQIFETSDLPDGVINVITGARMELMTELAKHDDVDGIWFFGDKEGSAAVEKLSASNLKRTWVSLGKFRNWTDPQQGEGRDFLVHASEVKNIWIPYGA
ncbi:MAG: aldehyde dehydrogenase family protein [Saprospiraceae bacterium]|nr:aldehyde dehydrogenase family protein [Saprospiraceae bacterium]